jgi:hypothetical protein
MCGDLSRVRSQYFLTNIPRFFDHVIPGPSEARNPESITPAQGLWIPGSPLRGAPE